MFELIGWTKRYNGNNGKISGRTKYSSMLKTVVAVVMDDGDDNDVSKENSNIYSSL